MQSVESEEVMGEEIGKSQMEKLVPLFLEKMIKVAEQE